jgi:hypothetical protein
VDKFGQREPAAWKQSRAGATAMAGGRARVRVVWSGREWHGAPAAVADRRAAVACGEPGRGAASRGEAGHGEEGGGAQERQCAAEAWLAEGGGGSCSGFLSSNEATLAPQTLRHLHKSSKKPN